MEFRLVDKKPQLWEETFFQTRKKVLVFGVWPWLLLLKAKALDGPVCSFSFVFSQGSGVWQRKRGCMGFEVVALSWPCGTSDELDYCYSTYCWTFMVYRKSCYLMVFWQWFFFAEHLCFLSLVWCLLLLDPVYGRLRQAHLCELRLSWSTHLHCEFQVSQDYTVRSCLKKQSNKNQTQTNRKSST